MSQVSFKGARKRPSGERPAEPLGRGPAPLLIAAMVAGALVLWSALIAGRQWFVADDFAFLSLAQQPRSWWDVFVPLAPRFWWSYRPLTIDVFFRVGLAVFGREPFGYLAVSLLFHFLSGVVVYRLATQFGFDARVAVITALLSICRYPWVTQGFWISAFQHVAANFFFLAAVSLFLDYVRSARPGYQLAAAAALTVTLLCNEMGATLPLVLLCVSFYAEPGMSGGAVRTAVSRIAPHVVITGIYLFFRLQLIGPSSLTLPPQYSTSLGSEIVANYASYLLFVFDRSPVKLVIACLLALAAVASVAGSGAGRRSICTWLLGVNAVCAAWIVIVMAPFVGFSPTAVVPVAGFGVGFLQFRFAMHIEAPVCLLFGSYLNALWRVHARAHGRAMEVALLCLLVAAVPYGVFWTQAGDVQGVYPKKLVELIGTRYPDFAPGTTFVILYGAPGLANSAQAESFRVLVFGGAALSAFYGEQAPKLLFRDLGEPGPNTVCPDCIYLQLMPGLDVEVAEAESLR